MKFETNENQVDNDIKHEINTLFARNFDKLFSHNPILAEKINIAIAQYPHMLTAEQTQPNEPSTNNAGTEHVKAGSRGCKVM